MAKNLTTDLRLDKIDNNLEKIAKIVTGHDDQLDKIDVQLDKIATIVVSGFERVDEALEAKADKKDLKRVYDLLDKISKQQEIDNDERLVMGHQLDRLDRWVHEVADKIGHKLTV